MDSINEWKQKIPACAGTLTLVTLLLAGCSPAEPAPLEITVP
jgi:hypothetical protein